MWEELIQSSIIPVIIVILLSKFFGGNAQKPSVSVGSKTDMDIVAGGQVIKVDGTRKAVSEIFSENDFVLFYFSAHWCPPCRRFTPVLAQVYSQLKASGKRVEVIFMSMDRSEDQMLSYMRESHGDWFAFEFNSPLRGNLGAHFSVQSIPTLIVLTGSGQVVTTSGVQEVQQEGAGVVNRWTA